MRDGDVLALARDHRGGDRVQALARRAVAVVLEMGLEDPLGAGPPRPDAVLHDAQVAVDVVAVDVALAQALARHGQEALREQVLRGVGLPVEPRELGAQAVAGGREEVHLRVVERDAARDVLVLGGERHHEAEPERGVGHLVHGRRARGQDAVLDAQVGLAVDDPVAGAVPAVDRAVVEAQRAQLGRQALRQRFEGVLVALGGDEDAVARDVLAVELDDGVAHPRPPEVDAGAALPEVVARAARVHRLLEDRDPRLVPEAAPEEHRRVHGGGEDRPRRHLRDVVHLGELGGADLEVRLEGRVAGLDHHRVVLDHQLVHALDADLVGLAP